MREKHIRCDIVNCYRNVFDQSVYSHIKCANIILLYVYKHMFFCNNYFIVVLQQPVFGDH